MGRAFADLCERDLRAAFAALNCLSAPTVDRAGFVDAAFEQLVGIVPSDLTTLSNCDLERGSRSVIGRRGESLSNADREAFDQHFRDHPLVRFHGSHPAGPTQRISDCMSMASFMRSPIHADYYRRIGINHVMALPLRIDRANVMSVVTVRPRHETHPGLITAMVVTGTLVGLAVSRGGTAAQGAAFGGFSALAVGGLGAATMRADQGFAGPGPGVGMALRSRRAGGSPRPPRAPRMRRILIFKPVH